MFIQKSYTTTGSELRLEFGFVPHKVTIENLTTGNILEWSSKYAPTVAKLIAGATGIRTTAGTAVSPITRTGLNGVSGGALGLLLPTNAPDNVNNTASQTIVVCAFRESDK